MHHVRLTDGARVGVSLAARAGGRTTGQVFVFRADAADPTETRWPRALRLLETNDTRVFDGSYQFTGDSVVEMLQHLCRFGLEFAPPETGDEGTYKRLFFAIRGIYESLAAEEAK